MSHYKVCAKCGVYWPCGYDLFTSWHDEDEWDWEESRNLLATLTDVSAEKWPVPMSDLDDPQSN